MFVHEFNLTKKRQVDVKSKFKRYYGIKKKKKWNKTEEMILREHRLDFWRN